MNSPPSLIETLVDKSNDLSPHGAIDETKEPSACELKCQAEQAALVSCMESLRQQQQRQNQNEEGSSIGSGNQCLGPAVTSWTECCASANSET
mmetsp:Transcript_17900/g.26809  ORF Transcript_17900/g.26809 Transcript_17900/m.26809 type:complete len:93 (-) Transcript_17900:467-745(-)